MRLLLAPLLLIALACGDASPGGADGAVGCTSDDQCDDNVFCNGVERCDPTDALASPLGCVAGTPCLSLCDERMELCTDDCEDADGDGFMAVSCGGSDCDDADPDRNPGATETCNGVDEDCDETTVGGLDADGDGFVAAECCNGDTCGPDCDDANPGVQPTEAESCDGVDNDCDGMVDEGVLVESWPDADGDRFGDAAATPELVCDRPSDAASRGGDCDDGNGDINPAAPDVCNDSDDDCDAAIDEDGDAICDSAFGPETVGRCVVHPETGLSSCHGIDCAGGGIVCGGGSQNLCDANACTSARHCAFCGRDCGAFTCSEGQCSTEGIANFAMGTVLDALSGVALAGATVEPRAECSTAPVLTSDASGVYGGSVGPFDELRIRAAGHLPAVRAVNRHATADDTDLMITSTDLMTIVADPDVGATLDPELGILLSSTATPADLDVIAPHGPRIHVDASGDASPYTGQSGGLILILNVLPGRWELTLDDDPLCMSGCDTEVTIVGGATSFVGFPSPCLVACV